MATMSQSMLSELVEEIDFILLNEKPFNYQAQSRNSFQILNDLLDQDHEKTLLEQWNTIKSCQCQAIVSAAYRNRTFNQQATIFLLKLCKRPYLVKLALGLAGSNRRIFVQGILNQVLFYQSTPNIASQPLPIDNVTELCESALPYEKYGGVLYSEVLLREIGNWKHASPSVWNRRVKALFGTLGLGALAEIAEPDLELAYENWKTLMKSADHLDSMVSVHIASSLYRLGCRHDVFAVLPQSIQSVFPNMPSTLSQWLIRARQLFIPPQGAKIFKVTFIRTVKAVVDTLTERSPFHLEMTVMAAEILPHIDVRCFRDWGEEAATALEKLKEKLLEPSIPPAVMAHAFCVLRIGTTTHETDVPTNFIALFEPIVKALLLQPQPFSANEMKSPWYFVMAVIELLPISSKGSVSKESVTQCLQVVLTAVFDLCRPANLDPKNRLGIEWASTLLRALEKHMGMSMDDDGFLPNIFCNVVRNLGFPSWWTINLSNPHEPQNCARLKSCPHHAEFARQQLCKDLSRIFMEISSQIDHLADCDDIVKLRAQAKAQRDMATPNVSWDVCRFGQVPTHLEELDKEKEKFIELTRALKITEEDLLETEQTRRATNASFSRAREGKAYLLRWSQNLSSALQDLHLERGLLQEQLSATLREMERQRENDQTEKDDTIRELREQIEDMELANHGIDLYIQRQEEVARMTQERLETQIQWLRQQLDDKDKELKEAHDKEIKALLARFEDQKTAMNKQLRAYVELLEETEIESASKDATIKELELQREELSSNEQQLWEENQDLTLQLLDLVNDNEKLSEKVKELEEMSEALTLQNNHLASSEEKWKIETERLVKEASELKEREQKLLDVLQRPH
ncbi:hypothetical protein LTR84_004905 [Exophiala bonariae]|uniref:Importin N-terminal domain-containing protein n=1 Tax=Exophiala bonariae TaxID=1690606 RepID=A0AAV9NNQ0_9EURO|nr:hypothetical protein LTR84_004905 [Exophiala bonariae]